MKKLRIILRIKFISNLSLKQKAQLKYFIALTAPANIRALFWPSINLRRNSKELKSVYQQFLPIRIKETLVRIGGGNDGGYLIPKISANFDGLISPGVGETSKFELEFAQGEIRTILIDASVVKPSNLPKHFLFLPMMVSATDGLDLISINTLVREYFQDSNNLALQMDIEGGEYEILGNLEKSDLQTFGLILVEFHFLEKMRESEGRKRVLAILELLGQEFALVHTHPNNAGGFFVDRFIKYPRVLETTWVRRGLVKATVGKSRLPHPLDEDNEPLMYSLGFPSARGS